jgi:hypothetical protein
MLSNTGFRLGNVRSKQFSSVEIWRTHVKIGCQAFQASIANYLHKADDVNGWDLTNYCFDQEMREDKAV